MKLLKGAAVSRLVWYSIENLTNATCMIYREPLYTQKHSRYIESTTHFPGKINVVLFPLNKQHFNLRDIYITWHRFRATVDTTLNSRCGCQPVIFCALQSTKYHSRSADYRS